MSIEKKTLVILTPGFPENEEDSTCLPMQQQLLRSMKESHPDLDIRVLAFQYPYHKHRYTWHGIRVIPFSGMNAAAISKLLLRKKILSGLKAINDISKINGILSFWYGECAFVGQRFSEKMGIQHYCWILGQDAKKENKYPASIHLKAGQLIALSDFIQDEFEKNHGERPAYVIPPGIDLNLFNSSPRSKEIDLLAAGSLIPLKQLEVFVSIVAETKKQFPELKATLIGDGPERKDLELLAKESGLQSTLTLTGEIPYGQVIELMQKAKVFLHPSSYEGFGMVCLEAIAAGAQTLSFVKPMKREIPGWRIAQSADEMTRMAIEILSNPGGRVNEVNDFDIKVTAKKIIQLIFP